MVTLIGFIKDTGNYQITEYGRIECKSDAEANTKGRKKCISKKWDFYQIKHNY